MYVYVRFGNGATICTRREIQCLRYAGFLLVKLPIELGSAEEFTFN